MWSFVVWNYKFAKLINCYVKVPSAPLILDNRFLSCFTAYSQEAVAAYWLATFRLDHSYEIEYDYNFGISNQLRSWQSRPSSLLLQVKKEAEGTRLV